MTIEERLLALLQDKNYRPQDSSGLARALQLDSRERPELRRLLRAWEAEGRLMRLRQGRFVLRVSPDKEAELYTGRMRRLPNGKLLFIANEEGQEALRRFKEEEGRIELFVPAHKAHGALDGDLVKARIRRALPAGFRRRMRGQRPEEGDLRLEVRVEEILERKRGSWVGIYRPAGRYGIMVGDGQSSPESVRLTEPPPPGLLAGMCIVVQVISYPIAKMEGTGRIVEVLGWPEDSGVDMRLVIHKHALADVFPEAVLEETLKLPETIAAAELANRDDWRERLVITIDPATARDYDDAVGVTRREEGGWELAVHIADVSHYVRSGSALDAEAQLRGNSTYLPDRVLPMLPPRLCDDLCSLREGEDRLTKLCLMQISPEGKVMKTAFREAVIRSRKRMNYGDALAVLEGKGSSGLPELDAMLLEANHLAALMRRRRFDAGALDLEMPELHVDLDAQGKACGLHAEESDEAHQLIEEFMLAANEAVAKALREKMLPCVYRVHEAPAPAKLHEFALQAKSYGIHAGQLDSRQDLIRVMQEIKGNKDEILLKTALLRSMMRARYSPKPLGHFGLAKGDYCHFTSPIRRYADLLVHRAFARLCGKKQRLDSPERLQAIADHISETERNSAAAEAEAEQMKIAEYLQEQCEAEQPRIWTAVITAAWPQGLAVEIPELRLRGFVSGAELPDAPRWYFERHASRWASFNGQRYKAGDCIRVIPLRIDKSSRYLEFRPASEEH